MFELTHLSLKNVEKRYIFVRANSIQSRQYKNGIHFKIVNCKSKRLATVVSQTRELNILYQAR